MVAINIGERKISVYQSLLDSVTDTFKKAPVPIDFGAENRTRSFELPVEDMGTFQMFLLWLYSANRCRQMEDYDTDSLIDLYVFGISLRCESLKADALHSLRRVLDEVCSGVGISSLF
jgi:hypothetical protein